MNKVQNLQFEKIFDERGNLSFIEQQRDIPFDIKRCYWIYDVPGGETRGGHAFRKQQEVIIALTGSFEVVVFDGEIEKTYFLNLSFKGLYIGNMIWRQMRNFSTNSVAFVLSSTDFDPSDYIYQKEEFVHSLKYENDNT